MNKRLMYTLTTVISLWGASDVWAFKKFERCPKDQLNQNDGRARHAWGLKCLPHYLKDVELINEINFTDDKINPFIDDDKTQRQHANQNDIDFKIYVGDARDPEWGYPGFHHVHRGERVKVWAIGNSKNEGASCDIPDDVRYTRICPAGCYSGNQYILFSAGYLPIADVNGDEVKGLITLSQEATLENLQFTETPLLQIVKDAELSKQPFIKLKTLEGGIEVTPNHPMLLASGHMKAAKNLKVGDELLRASGKSDQIVSITTTRKTAYAYNVVSQSPEKLEKIVVSQGFLTGDLYYQNKGVQYLNSLILRSQDLIPEEALN